MLSTNPMSYLNWCTLLFQNHLEQQVTIQNIKKYGSNVLYVNDMTYTITKMLVCQWAYKVYKLSTCQPVLFT